jgi:alkylated DNA repair dioxygenase AlkB
MDLFDSANNPPVNLLPRDGIAHYYGPILSPPAADIYLDRLLTDIAWQNDEAIIHGKRIQTRRKVAWYADSAFEYTYSGITKRALPWIDELRVLKAMVEQKSGENFNSCLLNLYRDGSEGMAWHSDAENDLKKNGAIASLSLGAERKFSFKHRKSKETVSLVLQHGSLLVMKDTTQTHWLHSLPPTKTIDSPRVNLTFRIIVT